MVRQVKRLVLTGFTGLVVFTATIAMAQERVETSLDGEWTLQIEGQADTRDVILPGTFEEQIAIDFDGIATYRKSIPALEIKPNRQLFLQFDAVATHATVWLNDAKLGEHLGGWTPFHFDITEIAMAEPAGHWEIRVEVDERVGHNTQGFLPIIAPHFGGIWQSVRLVDVPVDRIDRKNTSIQGDFDKRMLEVNLELDAVAPFTIHISIRERGTMNWSLVSSTRMVNSENDRIRRSHSPSIEISADDVDFQLRPWSPDDPAMYQLKVELSTSESSDTVIQPFAFRKVETSGPSFLLNDQPLNIRGLLNWGYAPPRTAPSLDEAFMRNEILFARERGFNLMKFCLWMPPKRYLELCDELGMLAWIEYPAWHPDFSTKHLDDLKKEYDEFFFYDRNHPSVILRSLTCETGPSAELAVIQSLYDQCKKRIPNAIVVDDSSWIAWNRVFDFYDDHPYGNNHTWIAELDKLKRFIAERETKPLMLGEAITADTWTDLAWFGKSSSQVLPDEFQPDFLDSSREWLADARTRYGESSVSHLMEDSKRYAMALRKYQTETFRREVPNGGYVVSVIRDMPKAGMGLIDFDGQAKWTPNDWKWHGDRMILTETENEQRSFSGGEPFQADVTAVGFRPIPQHENQVDRWESFSKRCHNTLVTDEGIPIDLEITDFTPDNRQGKPADDTAHRFLIDATFPIVEKPTRAVLGQSATDLEGKTVATNEIPIWVFPPPKKPLPIRLHTSAVEWMRNSAGAGSWFDPSAFLTGEHGLKSGVLLTQIIDHDVLKWLAEGGKVILLANGEPGSFPLDAHWFLRGGPIISEPCEKLFPRDMLVELQQFDMAGDVIRNIEYLDSIDPLFMLWEAHDLDKLQTNGLLFHMPVGEKGNLFVSALRHDGLTNPAGNYVFRKLVDEVNDGNICQNLIDPVRGKDNLERLADEIGQRKIMLDQLAWKFKPDPDEQGKTDSWFSIDHDDDNWATLQTDRHWESQGHDGLDHWAWYRIDVEVPEDWNSGSSWLNFTGVDDYYDVYVNGQHAGSGGDIETRQTAFELRTSHDISRQIEPGKTLQICVAVYDWYGAGGIFRPVWIANQPIDDRPRMLK